MSKLYCGYVIKACVNFNTADKRRIKSSGPVLEVETTQMFVLHVDMTGFFLVMCVLTVGGVVHMTTGQVVLQRLQHVKGHLAKLLLLQKNTTTFPTTLLHDYSS